MTGLELPPVIQTMLSTAGKSALGAYLAERTKMAREAIWREMAKGKVWAIADDKAAAMALQFLRALEEGAARRNLNLLAEAMFQAATEPTFAPDEFKRHADHLATLSYEEIFVVAAFVRAASELPSLGPDFLPRNALFVADWIDTIWKVVRQRLMTSALFRTEDDVEANCASLIRTGWLAPVSGFGAMLYRPTPRLAAMARLIDWEAAVGEANK